MLSGDAEQIADLRAQHGVGADAIDELDQFYELKVSAGAEPDRVTLTDSEVQRALNEPGFFLVVVSGVEGAKVVDLLAALRASVDATKARGKKHPETLADVAGLKPLARVGSVRTKRAKSAPRRRAHAAKRSRARHG